MPKDSALADSSYLLLRAAQKGRGRSGKSSMESSAPVRGAGRLPSCSTGSRGRSAAPHPRGASEKWEHPWCWSHRGPWPGSLGAPACSGGAGAVLGRPWVRSPVEKWEGKGSAAGGAVLPQRGVLGVGG